MNFKNKFRKLCFVHLMVIFVFPTFICTAQNKGTVLDQLTTKPLAGVNVYHIKSRVITVTNTEGKYSITKLSGINGRDTLHFSRVGYATSAMTADELKLKGYVVSLSEVVQQLKEVTILSERIPLKPEISYKQLTSMKEGVYAFGATLVGERIFVVGGDASFGEDQILKALNDFGDDVLTHLKPSISWQEFSSNLSVYDIRTDKWESTKKKFSKIAYHGIQYYKGKIYIIGGKKMSRDGITEYLNTDFDVFDLTRDSILHSHTNPHQAINFASVVYDGKLIMMGGSTRQKANGEKEYSNKVHLCNLKTGYWYELDSMPSAKETKGVLMGNTIYLAGGFRTKPLTDIESYNLTTGEWNSEGKLLYPAERPAIAYHENTIYIFDRGKIQTYNRITKQVNAYLIDLDLIYAEMFCKNNKLYLLGGSREDEFSDEPSSALYSIELDEFKKAETCNNL